MFLDRGMDKDDVAHIHSRISLNHGKEWNNAFCSNIDRPRDCHTEWSESEREGKILHDITYMWNLKKIANALIYRANRVTDVENKLMVTVIKR